MAETKYEYDEFLQRELIYQTKRITRIFDIFRGDGSGLI